jgi:hypothetical protein
MALPEDHQVWVDYAKDITRLRRNGVLKAKRDAARKRDLDAKVYHRDYMKDYMRSYRAGQRRRG